MTEGMCRLYKPFFLFFFSGSFDHVDNFEVLHIRYDNVRSWMNCFKTLLHSCFRCTQWWTRCFWQERSERPARPRCSSSSSCCSLWNNEPVNQSINHLHRLRPSPQAPPTPLQPSHIIHVVWMSSCWNASTNISPFLKIPCPRWRMLLFCLNWCLLNLPSYWPIYSSA